jgi:nanoRNase/pAp phosphatase (c-di-AMP/oligoRNAs hydrolase)
MRRRGLECSPNAATLLLLGIYEATGSLIHTTTRFMLAYVVA